LRISIIDGFRGFFLLFMMIIHLNLELDTTLGKLNHHYFGFVEDAQGFVFISGFVVGLVYTGILLRRSFSALRRAIFSRIFTIWTHQVGLILAFLAAAFVLARFGVYPSILAPYNQEPVFFPLASAALTTASKHMGILPMYIYFMIATPLALKAFERGYAPAVLAVSILSWMIGQSGILDWLSVISSAFASDLGIELRFGIFFNILSWQTIYFLGLWLGYLSAQKRLSLEFLKAPGYQLAAMVSAILFIYFGILDRAVHWVWVSEEFSNSFRAQEVRADFSTVHVVNFLTDLFLISWIVYVGRGCGVKSVELVSRFIHWIFTRPALVFLGQHSLHVFSFHLIVVYLVAIIYDEGPPNEFIGSIVLILGALSLYIPAWYNARKVKQRKSMPI